MNEAIKSQEIRIVELRALIRRAESRDDEAYLLKLESELRAVEAKTELDPKPNSSPASERKLFIPRKADGEPNYELLDMYRDLDRELKDSFYSYVGIIPVGSQITGEAKQQSDLDIRVLLDITVRDFDFCKMYLETEFEENVTETYDKEPHLLLSEVSMPAFKKCFEYDVFDSNKNNASDALALVLHLVVGERIGEYRALVRDMFNNLPASLKQQVLHAAISKILSFETISLPKIKNVTGSDFDEATYLRHRRVLWERRAKLLGFVT
jgi:hypothetical protein